jgi:RNA polymerase sigma-70 factor, ECF subfamily
MSRPLGRKMGAMASSARLTAFETPWVFAAGERRPQQPGPADRVPSQPGMNSGTPGASNQTTRDAEADLDRSLIERAQAGDTAAFRRLVERHQRRAFTIAVSLVRDEEDAREVVQEAFIRVYRGLSQFHGGSSFFTWLYRIVTNLSIDLIRRPARREQALEEVLEGAEMEDAPSTSFDRGDPFLALHRSELRLAIQKALDELPPYHRGVIVMREIQGMSYEEMAEAMQVSKGTIMSRLFHARRKLERALASLVPDAPRTESGDTGEGEA